MKALRIENIIRPIKRNVCKARQEYRKIRDIAKFIYNDCTRPETYVEIGGKRYLERSLPNSVGRPIDAYSVTGYKVKFYPEDEKIMDNMSPRDAINYGKQLLKDGKYIDNGPNQNIKNR